MREPKVVFFDLETLPDPRAAYKRLPSIGAWPGRTFKAELHTIISFGYKIQGQKVECVNSWDLSDDLGDDSALVYYIYDMLHDADEIVTHNGKSFDLKVINTRLAYYGMPPLPKIHHVDTKIVAKRGLSLYSNSLAEVAKFFGVEDKMTFTNKWGMWERMAFREETPEDRQIMSDYCKQDVEVLEQIYNKLRPHMSSNAVNKNLFVDPDKMVCPTCGSNQLLSNGYRVANTSIYKRLVCGGCGSWSRLNIKETKVSVI